jgi:phosphotriesterase-related protein
MSVITVGGIRDTDSLGIIAPHEHILVDIRNQFTEFPDAVRRELANQKVGIHNLDVLSRDPYAVKDNLVLEDISLAEKELLRFKKAGGETVVETTSREIGRDPVSLKKISESTGLNIIAGCGYYTQDTHPPDMDEKTVDEIKDEIVSEIKTGMDGTDVRTGVIGELGTSDTIHPNERKVLIAAAVAQRETGAGIIVHTYPWGQTGLEALDILSENGVDLKKVCINHVDVVLDTEYCKKIGDTGAYFEFDDFGKEYYIDREYRGFAGGVFARDIERVQALRVLIDSGYLSNIFITGDVCLKTLLHEYGGWGYDHILTHVVPMMLEEGITREQIDVILRENPKKFLDISKDKI